MLTVLNELFDLREKDKAQEIKRLETQLKHLKETVSKRKANKDKIVQQHLRRMLGEEEYLEW